MKTGLKIFLASVLSLSCAVLNAQSLPDFNKVMISSNARVNLIQGEKASIVLEDDPGKDASDYYRFNDNGWLIIHGNPHEEIIVTLPHLHKVEISGTGKLETGGTFVSDSLELTIEGVGKLAPGP